MSVPDGGSVDDMRVRFISQCDGETDRQTDLLKQYRALHG